MGAHSERTPARQTMSKPQVLAFIDWYKPFYKAGGPVRSMVNLVDHLHDRVDFHIVTGDRDYRRRCAQGPGARCVDHQGYR
jgi:hypothetical protein